MLSDVDHSSAIYTYLALHPLRLFLCTLTATAWRCGEDDLLTFKTSVRKRIWTTFEVASGWFGHFRMCWDFPSESIPAVDRERCEKIGAVHWLNAPCWCQESKVQSRIGRTSSRRRKGNNNSTLVRTRACKEDHLWMHCTLNPAA